MTVFYLFIIGFSVLLNEIIYLFLAFNWIFSTHELVYHLLSYDNFDFLYNMLEFVSILAITLDFLSKFLKHYY